MRRPALAAAGLVLALALAAGADVYVLTDGDRITGKTVLKGKASFAVQTAYGRLTIPRAKVERIVHDDGKEEILAAAPAAPATPPPEVRLDLAITGSTFWYAWRPEKANPPRAVLRLAVSLDEEPVATWLDARLDPEGISGAVVNTFGFGPDDSSVTAAAGVSVQPSEVKPGRILLKLQLPPSRAGSRRLRLAYQADMGPPGEPAWRDLSEGATSVELHPDGVSVVSVQQNRGQMEYSHKRMQLVETFKIEVRQ